jgi:general secretion pathway protein I
LSRSKLSNASYKLLQLEDARAGFTIIEALVALAVVAICLSAIGTLIAKNIHALGKINQHLELVEVLREVETALPDRAALSTGSLSGEIAEHAWSVDVRPFSVASFSAAPTEPANPSRPLDPTPKHAPPQWTPQIIVIKVEASSGSYVELETLRLAARAEK